MKDRLLEQFLFIVISGMGEPDVTGDLPSLGYLEHSERHLQTQLQKRGAKHSVPGSRYPD